MNSVISYTRKLQLKSLVEDTGNASIFMLSCLAEEETENELSTSISSYPFSVQWCHWFYLPLFSVYVLWYTITAIQYVIVTQASFPDVHANRLLIFRYTLAAFEDCDFSDEVFSFQFFSYGRPSSRSFVVSSCDWINQLVPLSHTSVERCIPFNCSKCTVFQIIKNYSQNRYLFSTFFTAIKCIYLIALFTH